MIQLNQRYDKKNICVQDAGIQRPESESLRMPEKETEGCQYCVDYVEDRHAPTVSWLESAHQSEATPSKAAQSGHGTALAAFV